jgi:heptosyltransferase-3
MRRILVLRGGALGDFIVTLPALAALRSRWPDARLELVGNATAATLVEGHRLLKAVHAQHEARWSTLYGEGPLPPDFARWLADFDLVVNFWPDSDGQLARRFPLRPAQVFVSAGALPAGGPAAAHFCAALRPLGIESADLSYPMASRTKAAWPKAPVAVHPGSGSPRKNWPAQNWRVVLDRLEGPVSLILGEAEGPAWDQPAPAHVTPWRSRSLRELADHLATCRLFLGHDSGISHLAAACGVPCVLLFGPTNPSVWAPPGAHVAVVRAGSGLPGITVDQVLAAAAAALRGRG